MWNTRLEKGQGSGGGRTCFKCGKTGHTTRNYPQANIEIWGGGAAVTRSKDVWNHKTDSSTYNGGGFSRVNKADEGCYNCREPGHFSRECPKLGLGGRTNGFSSRGFGSNENGWADQNGESKRPREKYIPPEILDETLFEHGISTGINFSKYDEIQCTVSGHKPPEPLENFEDVGLRSLVADNIKRSNYRDMTPVQRYALPIILKGRDMMACAQTGSGKTAAFLIPIVHTLLEVGIEPHMGHPQKPEAIIVTPTRELAIQITKEAKKFSFNSNIGCYCIYGGADVGHQSHELREKNINILVATPGRLLHFVRNDYLSFERVKYFVLDEADRMLDLGFMGDVEEIVRNPNMPGKRERQTLMFSATFPEEIQRAAATFLDDDYLFLKVGEIGGANTDVTQKIIQVDAFDKRPQLVSLLKDSLKSPKVTAKTLIFVEMKKTADFLAAYLSQDEVNLTSMFHIKLVLAFFILYLTVQFHVDPWRQDSASARGGCEGLRKRPEDHPGCHWSCCSWPGHPGSRSCCQLRSTEFH